MYYSYRRHTRHRRRHTNRGVFALMLLLTAVFLVSCVAGSNPLWIRGMFGVDAANYAAEPSERVLTVDCEQSAELCDMVEILISDGVTLRPFRSTSQAVRQYRDCILNDMLRDHYALYTGNADALAKLNNAYPNHAMLTLIPETDFENAVYRYFGGSNVSHKSGEVFEYLSRADAYTAPVQAWEAQAELAVLKLEETAHTYRMTFTLTDGDASADYFAVFVKRDDGSCYFYSLETLSK